MPTLWYILVAKNSFTLEHHQEKQNLVLLDLNITVHEHKIDIRNQKSSADSKFFVAVDRYNIWRFLDSNKNYDIDMKQKRGFQRGGHLVFFMRRWVKKSYKNKLH